MSSRSEKLPAYSLFVHPRDLQELRRDIWCDDPVPALLKVNGRSLDVDLAYRGEHTRKYPKKSYHLVFVEPAMHEGVQEIHLNSEYADASLCRSKLSFDFFASIGNLAPNGKHVLLKINGSFAGVYLQLESVDSDFLRKRGLEDGPIYYAVNDDANFSLWSPIDNDAKRSLEAGYQRKHGMEEDDDRLREFIYTINTANRRDFAAVIDRYLDVDKYLRWLAGVVCTQNFDAFIQNYSLYENGATGRYEIIPWDYDATWGRDCNGEIMEYDYVPITGFNTLTARVLDVPGFRTHYRTLMEEILDTRFTRDFLEPVLRDLHDTLHPHVQLDPFLSNNVTRFEDEFALMSRFIEDRNRYLKDHLSDLKR